MKVLKERLSALFDRNRRLEEANETLDGKYTETLKAIETTKAERAERENLLKDARTEVENYRQKYLEAVENLRVTKTTHKTANRL